MVGYQVWARRVRRQVRKRRILKFQNKEKQRKHDYVCDRMEKESPRRMRREYEDAETWRMFLADFRTRGLPDVPRALTDKELEDLIE